MRMSRPTGTVFTIVLTFICAIICTVILIHSFHGLATLKDNLHPNDRLRRRKSTALIIITLLASTLCVYCDFTRYFICAVHNFDEETYPLNQIMAIADLLLFIGDCALYSLAIYRLYITFHDTVYKIHNRVMALFTALIGIQCLTALYYCVSVALSPRTPRDATNHFKNKITPSVYVLILNDLILNGCLLLLFISKLRSTLTNTLISNSIEEVGSALDTISGTTVEVICRHSLLFGFAIITNQLFFSSNIAYYIWYSDSIRNLHYIVFCCRALENVSKSIVLFLGLKQNRSLYTKSCSQCHKGLAFCFVRDTQRKVKAHLRKERSESNYRSLPGSQAEAVKESA